MFEITLKIPIIRYSDPLNVLQAADIPHLTVTVLQSISGYGIFLALFTLFHNTPKHAYTGIFILISQQVLDSQQVVDTCTTKTIDTGGNLCT